MINEIGIVVPACNEQDLILRCVDAIAASRDRLTRHRPWIRTRLVVALDACTDSTWELLASRPDVELVPVMARSAGAARAAGTAGLLGGTAAGSLWLANTDADSVVPEEWLSAMIDHAEDGADLVVGTVLPDDGLDLDRRRRWDARHHLHDDHPHVHGANFGIRASAYVTLGGWSEARTGEDVELVKAAEAAGYRIVRSARHPVVTSSRAIGRAPNGFADYLVALAAPDGLDDLATPA